MARDSQEENSSKLVNSWILDNTYYTVLKEFVDKGEVSFSRDMVQGTVNLEKEEDRSIEGKVYILLMMCKLVDGADPNIEYYSEEDVKDGASLTALEDTLDIFDNVEELCNIDKTEAEILKNIIRRQAVFVCCADNNFELGKTIYGRCWSDNNLKKSGYTMKKQVEMVLKSEDPGHELLKEYTYDNFLGVCQNAVKKLHENNFSIPYLRKLAEEELARKKEKESTDACTQTLLAPELADKLIEGTVFQQLVEQSKLKKLAGRPFRLPEKLNRSWRAKLSTRGKVKKEFPTANDTDSEEDIISAKNAILPDRDAECSPKVSPTKFKSPKHIEVVKESPIKCISPARVETNISPAKKRRHTVESNNEEPETFQSKSSKLRNIDASSPTVSSSTPEKTYSKRFQDFKYRRNLNRINRHSEKLKYREESPARQDSSSDDAFVDDEDDPPRLEKPLTRVSRGKFGSGNRRQRSKACRMVWTASEEEKLYKAVQFCGTGNWAQIISDYDFSGRTNVNLKDKWRQISKSGRMAELKKKLGAVSRS